MDTTSVSTLIWLTEHTAVDPQQVQSVYQCAPENDGLVALVLAGAPEPLLVAGITVDEAVRRINLGRQR